MLTIGSLFAGIGGLELGLEWAGLGPVRWQVEIDPFCRGELEALWPAVPRFADVQEVGRHCLSPVDLVVGGFPCQDVSTAGKGAGLAGRRSGLWFQFARIVEEFRPSWVVVENVASGAKRWVGPVRRHLAELGYETLPVPLSAEDVGAPHLRRRVFVIAWNTRDACEVPNVDSLNLWERERGGFVRPSGDLESRQPGATVADRGGDGCGFEWSRYVVGGGGESDEAGHQPHRRDARVVFPPRPGDLEGWTAYLERGGPQPGVLPGTDGLPRDLAKAQIRALGNAVVPQCAEVVGWMIREMLP